MTPEARAGRCGEVLLARDRAFRWFGFDLVAIAPGRAVIGLTVLPDHANGLGICHGGVIFSLADTAFAFAGNSRNRAAVAQHHTISYIAPGQTGDRLTATAREISLRGRSGLYDVSVTRQTGETIAEMRASARVMQESLFDEPETETG